MEKIARFLKNRTFVNLATADKEGQPNAVPKFYLKFEPPHIYLIDYTIARTVNNLRANPRASIPLTDLENLEGYRINGSVELIEKGSEFGVLAKELSKKLVHLSADRVIEAVRTGKKSQRFEMELPDKFIAIKFKIEDIVKIGPQGDLYREEMGQEPQSHGLLRSRKIKKNPS